MSTPKHKEYNGTNYFWWDNDNDGVAEIYPSLGASGPSANIDGDAIASGDFHEVSFGYQLAWYQREGFRVFAIERDFFLENYPEPIYEQGIQLKDMLRLVVECETTG